MQISLDFETRSTVDLTKSGVYPYAAHPSTDVLCLCFTSEEDDEVFAWQPIDGLPDERLLAAVRNPSTTFRAWNAGFERAIWREIMVGRYGWPEIDLDRWYCTAADAAACSLPRSLDNAARVVGAAEQKDSDGKKLMLKMSKPKNAALRKIDPSLPPTWIDDYENRQRLVEYCKQDVRTEMSVAQRIRTITAAERQVFLLDQKINDRGVMLDKPLALAVQAMAAEAVARANAELRAVSGGRVEGVTKVKDMLAVLGDLGIETDSLDKQAVSALLGQDIPEAARLILELRRDAGKSSVSKVAAMLACASPDERMRGALLYHGAGTGRWAGRLYQPQNLPSRSKLVGFKPEKWIARIVARHFDALDMMFPALEALALTLRSCLRAGPGKRFIGADFNAIEARVLAWLAGEQWIIDAFRNGDDLYRVMAAEIYSVPLDQVGKPSAERDMGKRSILGCGFQMGGPKFVGTCLREGGVVISENFGKAVVTKYRNKNSRIVEFWRELEDAAIEAVKHPGRKVYAAEGKLIFVKRGDFLNILLPGRTRALAYWRPEIRMRKTPWGAEKECVSFWGENSKRQWVRSDLYGGLLAENVTQATARDLMASGMLRLEAAGYPIVLSVHDEILAEPDEGFGSLEEFCEIMCDVPDWAKGCPVTAEGWIGPRFKK